MFTTSLIDHSALISRNDPTPDRGSQLPRAASLVVSSLGFIHDLRAGLLEPDTVRGTPLDMDQYSRLFGTSRIPTDVRLKPLSLLIYLTFFLQRGCRMEVHAESRHIVVLRRGQFCLFLSSGHSIHLTCVFNVLDWFDVLDDDNLPVLTEREVLRNLQAIVTDADKTDKSEVNTFLFPLPLPNHYL